MGQGFSCSTSEEQVLFSAVQLGELETVEAILKRDSSLIHHSTVYDRNSPLHIAAANGQIEVWLFKMLQNFFDFLLCNQDSYFLFVSDSFIASRSIREAGFIKSA